MTPDHSDRLRGAGIEVGYDQRTIISGLDVQIPDGSFTVIIGSNACGKSTLLRTLSRLLKASSGAVLLDGRDVHEYNGKAFAREVGLLPQQSLAPDGITVVDLVSRGRFPYQTLFKQWTDDDGHEPAITRRGSGRWRVCPRRRRPRHQRPRARPSARARRRCALKALPGGGVGRRIGL